MLQLIHCDTRYSATHSFTLQNYKNKLKIENFFTLFLFP
ncbi:hypothetical protein HFN_0758 [Helicobacter fennelliae MRY12-0050]|uniref:Uncharacterized protein n=1 Tax=Helicobacter fennelliae MRY12-0050 TaxID=1325130 RepID=T1DWD3_9HELI|nr:hypothetical protein HFN_0758 [Helicobacter fennelliae MRY12-0050]